MMQSAVRLPTPPPLDAISPKLYLGRKRSPPSRSPSPVRRGSPPYQRIEAAARPNGLASQDAREQRANERERQLAERFRQKEPKVRGEAPTEEQKQNAAKAEYEKLLNVRSGGTYIPPARLRALQTQITDKSSKEYQRMAMGGLEKVDQWSHKQGQCLQYQTYRTRAFWRESRSWKGSLLPKHYESPGCESAFYSHLRSHGGDRQYEASTGRRALAKTADCAIQESIQEE